MPDSMDFHEATALCFGGTTALHFLRKAGLQRGQAVLVLGGSGAVGMAMVQLAVHQGATVTATTSAANLSLLESMGATALDYRATDMNALPQRFNIVADTVGAMDFPTAQALLQPGGRYLAIAGGMKEMIGSLRRGPEGKRMIVGPAAERLEDIVDLGQLAAQGHCRPHIERVFAFSDLPAAHAYVDTGRKRGSVVITVAA